MNYYNPYFMMTPTLKPSLFGAIRNSGITFGSIINGTQKTLGLINQAIPIVKQVKPVFKNAKTMFKVMNEFKKSDSNNIVNETKNNENVSEEVTESNGPTFFI